MTAPRRLSAAIAMIASTAMIAAFAGAPAMAMQPPVVDPGALVKPAPAGPTEPTEQRSLCTRWLSTGRQVITKPTAAQSMMNLDDAWRFSRGAGQKVAVIDTGVTPSPRLGRVIGGGDYVHAGSGLVDCDSHGTAVASIIAARPGPGDAFVGVAPEASLISIRQSSASYSAKNPRRDTESLEPGVGPGYGSVRTLAHAVVRAVELGATVINISEVACGAAGRRVDDRALGAAVKYAFDHDVVVVAAAGNLDGESACRTQNPEPQPADDGWASLATIASPAWFSRYVLTVGSVDAGSGAPSTFSLHGPWMGVAGPGTEIVGLDSRPGSTRLVDAEPTQGAPNPLHGTSFAAAYVSGTVALVRARFPQAGAAEVIDRITRTAHGPGTGRDNQIGYGVIDPVAALTADLSGARPSAVVAAPIAAPAPEPAPDHSARNAAVAGCLAALALVIVVLGISLPHRRVRRLEPDEY